MMHTEKFIDETRNKELGMFFFMLLKMKGLKKKSQVSGTHPIHVTIRTLIVHTVSTSSLYNNKNYYFLLSL